MNVLAATTLHAPATQVGLSTSAAGPAAPSLALPQVGYGAVRFDVEGLEPSGQTAPPELAPGRFGSVDPALITDVASTEEEGISTLDGVEALLLQPDSDAALYLPSQMADRVVIANAFASTHNALSVQRLLTGHVDAAADGNEPLDVNQSASQVVWVDSTSHGDKPVIGIEHNRLPAVASGRMDVTTALPPLLALDTELGQAGVATQTPALPIEPSKQSQVAELPAKTSAATQAAQPMVQVLAQRIHFQQAQGVDVVTVRLDPPHLGTLEIRVQSDVAGVQVQLQASHAEVGRQLAVIADSLRQELQGRSAGEASVMVATSRSFGANSQTQRDGSQQHAHTRHEADELIGQALYMGDELS